MTKLVSVLIAPLVAMALIPSPASAGTGGTTARVVHGDLDLASKEGRATFDRRLRAAMDEVCGRLDRSEPGEVSSVAECRREVARVAGEKIERVLVDRKAVEPVRGTH